jgi:hypothetical protein
MTHNQILLGITSGLSPTSGRPFHAGSLAAVAVVFTESPNILWVDRLTLGLTTGSITASQTPAKREFYA